MNTRNRRSTKNSRNTKHQFRFSRTHIASAAIGVGAGVLLSLALYKSRKRGVYDDPQVEDLKLKVEELTKQINEMKKTHENITHLTNLMTLVTDAVHRGFHKLSIEEKQKLKKIIDMMPDSIRRATAAAYPA